MCELYVLSTTVQQKTYHENLTIPFDVFFGESTRDWTRQLRAFSYRKFPDLDDDGGFETSGVCVCVCEASCKLSPRGGHETGAF